MTPWEPEILSITLVICCILIKNEHLQKLLYTYVHNDIIYNIYTYIYYIYIHKITPPSNLTYFFIQEYVEGQRDRISELP